MKEITLKAIEQIENMENDFDIGIIELAIYLYCRFGKSTIEKISEQDFEEIQNKIFSEETLFNQNINDFMESKFNL